MLKSYSCGYGYSIKKKKKICVYKYFIFKLLLTEICVPYYINKFLLKIKIRSIFIIVYRTSAVYHLLECIYFLKRVLFKIVKLNFE